MAANGKYGSERYVAVVPTNPVAPTSGQAMRFGKRVGIALTNVTADGTLAVDFGGVYTVSVKGSLGDGITGAAIAAGDWVYYTDGHTYLNAAGVGDGYLAGQALQAVTSGATANIDVAFFGVPGGTLGAAA